MKKVLETYDMLDAKPMQSPLAAHFRLCNLFCPKTEDEKSEMQKVLYENVVRCLMYAMILIRLDISHDVNVVNRYMTAPGKEHWRGVEWILRYLKGTLDLGLVYGRIAKEMELKTTYEVI